MVIISAGQQPGNPSTCLTSRRDLIGGAGLLAVAVTAPMSGASAAPRPSKRLLRTIALYDRSIAEAERYARDVHDPARAAWKAELKARPREADPPHEETATSYVNVFGETVRLSTACLASVTAGRKEMEYPSPASLYDKTWRQANKELVAAADRRDAIIADQQARRQAFEQDCAWRHRIGRTSRQGDALFARADALRQAACKMPAASLPDLLAKVDFIERTSGENDLPGDIFAGIAADIRRVGREGRK